MKTIKRIQNVLVGAGIITAIGLVDGMEVPASNQWAALVIATFSIMIIIEREVKSEK